MDIEQQIAAEVQRIQASDEAGIKAVYDPLPGPTKQIFDPQGYIEAVGLKIRPFYDIDFEWLKSLDHPLHKMMVENHGKPEANNEYIPRGPHAWQLAWLMTHPVDDVDKVFEEGGNQSIIKSAKKEFYKSQLQYLAQIHVAIMQQLQIYFSGCINYGSPGAEGEKSGPPSGAHSTGSDGSSTSVVS
jgi:hypothetical protein